MKEHHKNVNSQNKFDSQLLIAQQSAGQQIDSRIDKTLAGLDAKVKNIIKDTVKIQSIKKESLYFNPSLLECELTSNANFQSLKISGVFLIFILTLLLSKETDKLNQLIFVVLIMGIKDKTSKWITEKTGNHIMLKDKVNLL